MPLETSIENKIKQNKVESTARQVEVPLGALQRRSFGTAFRVESVENHLQLDVCRRSQSAAPLFAVVAVLLVI
ncbi:MAG: hypothetical protein ACK5P7_13915, partial [Bdellovibrio sp.]